MLVLLEIRGMLVPEIIKARFHCRHFESPPSSLSQDAGWDHSQPVL